MKSDEATKPRSDGGKREEATKRGGSDEATKPRSDGGKRGEATKRRSHGATEGLVMIEVPVGEVDPKAYMSNHLDTRLDGPHAKTLRRVFNALYDSYAELNSGKTVKNVSDVVKWMLERIGEAAK